MDRNDLFVRLGKYTPTPNHTPVENFFTELVAYILDRDKSAREEFMKCLPKSPTDDSFSGEIRVETQQRIESESSDIQGKQPDIWLRYEKGGELIIESKMDAVLNPDQLQNYLRYAGGREDRGVIVVSKSRNPACARLVDSSFWGEVLWCDIADHWNRLRIIAGRENTVEQFLIDGTLEFMEKHNMGPLEPFEQSEMRVPSLWRSFQAKVDKLLSRLCDRLRERHWESEPGLARQERCNKEGYYMGTLWQSPPTDHWGSDFWYFLGFIYGKLDWLFQPAGNDKPEAVVFVGAWGADESMKNFLRGKCEKLNGELNNYPFTVVYSADGLHPFLVRRRPLGEFINCVDQASAILNFFEESDRILAPHVPEIYEKFREPAGHRNEQGAGQ